MESFSNPGTFKKPFVTNHHYQHVNDNNNEPYFTDGMRRIKNILIDKDEIPQMHHFNPNVGSRNTLVAGIQTGGKKKSKARKSKKCKSKKGKSKRRVIRRKNSKRRY